MVQEPAADFVLGLSDRVWEGIADLTHAELRWRPEPYEWSPVEVCGHLRDAVDIEVARLRALLADEQVVLPAFDGVAYAREHLYQYDDAHRMLGALRAPVASMLGT